MPDQRDALRNIRTFPQLIKFLRDELEWPIESQDFEELTFDYTPEELGIDTASAAKIQEIKRLRPLSARQPWGIFFVKFEPKRLPVVALRRVLSRVVLKKRASANSDERAAWQADDLLFISNYGEGDGRQISFAHFSQNADKADLPTLKVLGWDNRDTALHLDDVAETLHQKLVWPADARDAKRWRETWQSAFTLRHREVITTSKDLAERLAELARAIRDRIQMVLAIETENGPLTRLMKAFQQALIHDLSADDFADMYAQTIAYGLLSARVAHPAHDTADAVATHIPVTNAFLKELMETFLHLGGRKRKERGGDGIDFDELGVSEVVELLDAANMGAVTRDFGDRNRDEDPVIHFYELFLKEYDAKKRIQRGVFYTPQPVVSYIVRSVHNLLQTEFGLEDGLASTVTWGEMAAKHAGFKIPDGVSHGQPFVVILDPATGTATFLVEVIDVIYLTLMAKWKQQRLTEAQQYAAWNEYVPKHLLPRLYGYELLMAPYAIAHMKIGLKLYETGYRFDSDERARIYLTNALEPASDDSKQMRFAEWVPALAHEAQAVNEIKRHQRFTIVVGNPPYSIRSGNLTDEARRLVQPFKFVAGQRIVEKGALQLEKNLNDDYVKFFGLIQKQLSAQSVLVVGLITNHAFLDNPTFRGFRWNLLANFSRIKILDLHGNSKKKEQVPEGQANENVFDIQQGVAITLLVRRPAATESAAVALAEQWGTRESKYQALESGAVEYRPIDCPPPWFKFSVQDAGLNAEFNSYFSLADAMPLNSSGMKTHRDAFVIDFDEEALRERVMKFRSTIPDAEIAAEFGLADTYGWRLTEARRRIRARSDWQDAFQLCLYRPFDIRHIYYHSDLVELPRIECMQHLTGGKNLALLATRQVTSPPFNHVLVTRLVSEMKTCSHDRGTNAFPLYLKDHPADLRLGHGRRVNYAASFLRSLGDALNIASLQRNGVPEGLTPEDIFYYGYAVFHSPQYRQRYAEFLKTEFPRLPLTGNLTLFRALARLGEELVALHLLESPKLDKPLSTYIGPKNHEVEKSSYSRDTVWIDKAQTCGFRGVPEVVWNFDIGGYPVCEKWLKDRKGRTLSKDDIAHYQKIVAALSETIRLMQEIDEVVEAHGGWPGAFQ
jgi:predicted helicase